MIDTHCHLLPDLDDGPGSAAESLALARALVDAGVHTVVCTPHRSRRWPIEWQTARDRFDYLVRRLDAAGIELRVGLAAELSSVAAVELTAEELRRRQLGPGYVLVELESDTPSGSLALISRRLESLGLRPVFAHPERCRAIREQPRILDEMRSKGALVQVVAASLVPRQGARVEQAAWRLLESERVDLLASDAHRARHGGPALARVLESVARRLGRDEAVRLVETSPAQMLGTVGGRP